MYLDSCVCMYVVAFRERERERERERGFVVFSKNNVLGNFSHFLVFFCFLVNNDRYKSFYIVVIQQWLITEIGKKCIHITDSLVFNIGKIEKILLLLWNWYWKKTRTDFRKEDGQI